MSSKTSGLGPKDIIFPIMGPTGAGKSTFINIALGITITEVGDSMTGPCTKIPLPIIIDPIPNHPELGGYRLVLLDTPGFDATYQSDVETLKCIAERLEAFHREGALIGGALYFHDMSEKQFTSTAHQNLLMFSRLCGDGAMPKTGLVTTNWPSDRDNALELREEELRSKHWKTFMENGLDVRRFQRNHNSAWDIINHLLQGIPAILPQRNDADNRLNLRIQAELVKLREVIPKTEAGHTLEQLLLKKQEEAVALEPLASTGDRRAQEKLKTLRATISKLQDQLKDHSARLSLSKRFLKIFGVAPRKRR